MTRLCMRACRQRLINTIPTRDTATPRREGVAIVVSRRACARCGGEPAVILQCERLGYADPHIAGGGEPRRGSDADVLVSARLYVHPFIRVDGRAGRRAGMRARGALPHCTQRYAVSAYARNECGGQPYLTRMETRKERREEARSWRLGPGRHAWASSAIPTALWG